MASKVLKEPIKYTVEEELKKCTNIKLSDIEMLKEWCGKQRHLPQFPEETLILFLHSNYGSMEAAKNTVECYYTMRTHIPEFFSSRDPIGTKEFRTSLKTAAIISLPGKTKEGYKVVFAKFTDTDPANYHFNEMCKYFFMVCELHILKNGVNDGAVFVGDATGLSLGHVGRINIASLKKLIYYVQEAIPVRLKAIHFVNTPPALDVVLNIAKPFMKKELWNMIHLHSTSENLGETFPNEMLPNDLGGTAGLISQFHAEQIKELEENREYFLEEGRLRVNESLRVGKSKTASDLFGVEGSFKKLDID